MVGIFIRAGSFLVWRELEPLRQQRYYMEGQRSQSVHQGREGNRPIV